MLENIKNASFIVLKGMQNMFKSRIQFWKIEISCKYDWQIKFNVITQQLFFQLGSINILNLATPFKNKFKTFLVTS